MDSFQDYLKLFCGFYKFCQDN